tara:strand:+ start:1019 stop:1357 length:339 start_codon:yes stop_codon:yes gene_type:complete
MPSPVIVDEDGILLHRFTPEGIDRVMQEIPLLWDLVVGFDQHENWYFGHRPHEDWYRGDWGVYQYDRLVGLGGAPGEPDPAPRFDAAVPSFGAAWSNKAGKISDLGHQHNQC